MNAKIKPVCLLYLLKKLRSLLIITRFFIIQQQPGKMGVENSFGQKISVLTFALIWFPTCRDEKGIRCKSGAIPVAVKPMNSYR